MNDVNNFKENWRITRGGWLQTFLYIGGAMGMFFVGYCKNWVYILVAFLIYICCAILFFFTLPKEQVAIFNENKDNKIE